MTTSLLPNLIYYRVPVMIIVSFFFFNTNQRCLTCSLELGRNILLNYPPFRHLIKPLLLLL